MYIYIQFQWWRNQPIMNVYRNMKTHIVKKQRKPDRCHAKTSQCDLIFHSTIPFVYGPWPALGQVDLGTEIIWCCALHHNVCDASWTNICMCPLCGRLPFVWVILLANTFPIRCEWKIQDLILSSYWKCNNIHSRELTWTLNMMVGAGISVQLLGFVVS